MFCSHSVETPLAGWLPASFSPLGQNSPMIKKNNIYIDLSTEHQ